MRAFAVLLINLFAILTQALAQAAGVKEPFGIKCLWTFTLRDADGNVKQRQRCNLIVDAGFDAILMSLFSQGAGTRPNRFQYIGIGGGGSTPAAGDVGLVSEFTNASNRVLPTLTYVPGSKTVLLSAEFGPGVGTGTVVEAGLFNAITAGTMFNRVLIGAFNKQAADSLTVEMQVDVQ